MDKLLPYFQDPDAQPLFVTGAGLSLASGIPTFRGNDPDAVWAKDVVEKGTFSYFQRHPHKSWAWYLDRFNQTRFAEPNAGHFAIRDIEDLIPSTKVVTQNVDGMHSKAGSKNVIEIHGSSSKIRCTKLTCKFGGRRYFLPWSDSLFENFDASNRKSVPRCPHCNKHLRAHILWFDESYASHNDYRFDHALAWARKATVLVFVGTSFSVGITDWMLEESRCPAFSIDPYGKSTKFVEVIKAKAEEVLPELAVQLHTTRMVKHSAPSAS